MGEARETFLEACRAVASAFESEGYRWAESKCDLVKKESPFTFRLHFQSSPRNVLLAEKRRRSTLSSIGHLTPSEVAIFEPLPLKLTEIDRYGSVAMIPHIAVDDKRIAEWRKTLQRPIRTDGSLIGFNLGYLAKQRTWLEINLANPHERASRIAALISLIRAAAIPFFNRFRHDEDILATLDQSDFVEALEFAVVEHAVFLGGVEAGRKVIERCFLKWPMAEPEYRAALIDFRKNGIPGAWDSKAGQRLAKAALCLGIEEVR